MLDRVSDVVIPCSFCVQAEDGIRDLVRSRGLGDVYKRQGMDRSDSIVMDPHKGLFLPYGTGAVLVKNRKAVLLSLIHI